MGTVLTRLAPLALLAVGVWLSGCAARDPAPRSPSKEAVTSAPTQPDGVSDGREAPGSPAPTVPGVRAAPPPAWIEVGENADWLAFSSYCWAGTCITARPAEARTDIPEVALEEGAQVTFNVQFPPSALELEVGGERYPLDPGEEAVWPATGAGGLARLRVTADGQSAEYLARFVIS